MGSFDAYNASGQKVEYKYNRKYKHLYSVATYDENEQLTRKERFYWQKPGHHSEYLLRSHLLEGDGIRHFCRHLEYDQFGNITKNHLWGNLTGNNMQHVALKDGVPIDNGCEVYTKEMEASQDGFNLPLYEADNRKWVRQSYYPKTNLLKARLTGSEDSILKREYFRYDDNGALVEEIWDDGQSEDPSDLNEVTERHIRVTTPRKQFPIGLPEKIQEYYYDLSTGESHLVKQLINHHSPEGRILSQEHYGSDGVLAYTLHWDYDNLGNVIEETNAIGETITRIFDERGNKKEEHGPNTDAHTVFEYDHADRLIKETEIWTNGQTFTTIHRYNTLSQKIATIDPNGRETSFSYDRLGHLTKTVHPGVYDLSGELIHPKTETLYNIMGQDIAGSDANGHWTKREYTIRGQLCKIHYPDGSSEQKEYSLDGLLVKEVAKNGLVTSYAHDSFGRVTLTEKYSPEGELLSKTSATYDTFHIRTETDEAGLVTGYDYDGAGRRLSVTKGDKLITYAYDALGRTIKETEGNVTAAKEYDLLDRVIEERIEDAKGKTLTKKQYRYDCNGNRTHEITYSQPGMAVQITAYNPHNEPLTIRDALGHESHFTYKKIGHKGQMVNRIVHTDPLGNQEIKIYDTLSRISESKRRNPFGKIIRSESHIYDAAGQKLQTIAKVFNGDEYSRTVITEWEYDCMGNMIHCIEAKGTTEQKNSHLVYNLNGEKAQIIKPNGTILFHEYDLFGRLKRFHSSDKSIDYIYTYDANDNPVCIEDKVHKTSTIRAYDKFNRLLSETLDSGFTLSYTYDQLDRPLTIILPDQSAIHYTYTSHYLSRIDRIKESRIAYSHHYTDYDQAENLLGMKLPGQAGRIEFKYDLLQRLVSMKAPHWQETVSEKGYDAVGNLLQRQIVDAQGIVDYIYTYDDLYQLSSEKGHASHTYANDSLYNRVAKNDQPYQVNDLNQLLQQTDCTYIYDPNGNLIAINSDEQTIFGYDALDRLTTIKKGDRLIHYRYDSFHRRLSKAVEGVTTDYIYLKDNEIGTIVGQATKELRILGLGKGAEIGAAVAIELEGTPYVPIHDPYGNVTTLLNLNGEVTTSYRYTAFGEEEISGQSPNAWRYSSKRVDPETGYIYFGRRYYMPSIGRWLTPDPLWFADGPNLYAYVHNRPLTSIDPDGQFAFLIPIALSLALDYCMPTIVAGLTEYAVGGGLVASALSGFVSGYNDPLSSAFDPDTYSIGDADWASFACNRACMLLGATVACKPTNVAKNGVKSVVNVASREIAGTVIGKAEVAITKTITNGAKQGAKTAAQKTALVAERNFAKGGVVAGSNYVNLASKTRTNHILFGNVTGGGHLYPGINGKSCFPKSWDADKIMHYLSDIATDPKIRWQQISGKIGAQVTRNGLPVRYQAIGVREGISIKTIIEPGGEGIITGFPLLS